MDFITNFFRQKVPKRGTGLPAYYRKALGSCEVLLAIYFTLMGLLLAFMQREWTWVPFALAAVALYDRVTIHTMDTRFNLILYAATTCVWVGWYVRAVGWNSGVQPQLLTLLVMVFFDIYIRPWEKAACFVALLAYRVGLYVYSLSHPPLYALGQDTTIAFQTVNSVMVYLTLGCICVLLSTNIQEAERQLRLDNQELHKEAGTDPLTQLTNRRAMLDEMMLYLQNNPSEYFCVAIADIDFFKRVNDTYGHSCGDYTLCRLADLFREQAKNKYRVARWGGEEFCFFLPGMNIDTAGREMVDLNVAVSRMKLSFEGNEFSITITIGIGEWDFHSPINEIIENADQKLYMGKERGRNQVVI